MPALRSSEKIAKTSRSETCLACGTDCDCANGLLRTLVEKVSPLDVPVGQTQEILLDTDIGGSRYLLVRLPKSDHAAPALSPREQEIVRMVSQGCPNKVIAGVLNISSWTVSTHLRRIFAKLGVTSRAAMVAQMLEVYAARQKSSFTSR